MKPVEARRQAAVRAGHIAASVTVEQYAFGPKAVREAVDTATRVTITPEVVAAWRSAVEAGYRTLPTGQVEAALTAALVAAGFEVEQ